MRGRTHKLDNSLLSGIFQLLLSHTPLTKQKKKKKKIAYFILKNLFFFFLSFRQYDATVFGGYGGGGEYEVQLGFGWSNGLVMILLDKYGSTLTAENKFVADNVERSSAPQQVVVSTAGQVMTGILALIISLAAGFIG